MNYIGSKYSLLQFLDESIGRVVSADCESFCDLFAGTGAVGAHFKRKGYRVLANDIQYYSFVLNKHYIGNNADLAFAGLVSEIAGLEAVQEEKRATVVCESLSCLEGRVGFVFRNYCRGGTLHQQEERLYFSNENGMLCDAIRMQIEDWKVAGKLSEGEYFFLLASLIESIDRHANTASVYGAFLKRLKRSAQKKMTLQPAEILRSDKVHSVFFGDVNTLSQQISGDIFYFDPPYNQRQYAANYHLLETIARYDSPAVYGKTGLRPYEEQRSRYCSKQEVKQAFAELIAQARARYIFLSYNNEGLLSAEDIREIMSQRGRYGLFTQEYNRFRADAAERRYYRANTTVEQLHYVVCEQ